ncbi:MAG: alginate O-acetyltransferase AlgX-related protein [Litorimonas sp.]
MTKELENMPPLTSKNLGKLGRVHNLILVSLFALAVGLPFGFSIVDRNKEVSVTERRKLETMPALPQDASTALAFPDQFNAYFADHFGFRDPLVNGYNIGKYLIGDVASDNVMRGKEGWLYIGSPKSGNIYETSIDSILNQTLYDDAMLKATAKSLLAKRDWLESRGIEYIFVAIPEKHTVYPEYLPDYAARPTGPNAYDQIVSYLQENTDLTVVDLKPPLLEAKKDAQVYFRTDTHWNHNGAAIGFEKISQTIKQVLPNKDITLPAEFVKHTPFRGDLSNMIGFPDYDTLNPKPKFSVPCNFEELKFDEPVTIHSATLCPKANKSVLVFHDSFFGALKSYFSENFARAEYFRSNIRYDDISEQIDVANPDLVIEQMVERRFVNGIQMFRGFEVDNKAEKKSN